MQKTTCNNKNWRPLWAVLLLAFSFIALRQTGVFENVSVDNIRSLTRSFGSAAPFIFVLLTILGVAAGVPGALFIPGGVVAFGPVLGAFLSWIGLVFGSVLAVEWVQRIGGAPLQKSNQKSVKKAMQLLHKRPIFGVILVRWIIFASPPANAALAFAGIRPLQNIIGTLLGVLPLLIFATLSTLWLT